jgi:peptidoglycan/LPS O-acetylase OafA/YrhL
MEATTNTIHQSPNVSVSQIAPRPEAIPALTGIRFVAALGVVAVHLPTFLYASLPAWTYPFIALGRDGVDLFFVLSGFVLAYNYADWFANGLERRWQFLWIRAARIYPLAFAAFLAAVPVTLAVDSRVAHLAAPVVIASLLSNALLIHAWVLPIPDMVGLWDKPSWSISIEVLLYYFFPALSFVLLRHIRTFRAVLVVTFGAWLAGCTLVFALNGLLIDALFLSPFSRCWEFIAGAALGVWRVRVGSSQTQSCWRDLALVGCVIAFFATVLRPAGILENREWYVLAFPIGVALVALLGFGPSRIGDLLGRPWMVDLGNASYALYLLHWPAFQALDALNAGRELPLPVNAALLAALPVASLASYRWLESPARRWLRVHQPVRTVWFRARSAS